MAKLQKNSEVRSVKACFSTSFLKKGSMAVETALVLPLFFSGMVTLISLIYKLQTEHLSDLCNQAGNRQECMLILREKAAWRILRFGCLHI